MNKKVMTVVAGAMLAVGGATPAMADADAAGTVADSPGVASGNLVQVPVHVPADICSSVDGIAVLSPTFGNFCV